MLLAERFKFVVSGAGKKVFNAKTFFNKDIVVVTWYQDNLDAIEAVIYSLEVANSHIKSGAWEVVHIVHDESVWC